MKLKIMKIEFKNGKHKRDWVRDRRVYWLRKIKTSIGCEKCGWNGHPIALHFAHIDPKTKHLSSTGGTHGHGIDNLYKRICITEKHKDTNTRYIKELIAEVRKCKILCANCHQIETFENKEYYGQEMRKYRMEKHDAHLRRGNKNAKKEEEERGNLEAFL